MIVRLPTFAIQAISRYIKVVDNQKNVNLTLWRFSLDGGSFVPADGNGNVDFGQVTTGDTHTIVEQGPSSYTLISVTGTGENCTKSGVPNTGTATVFKEGTTICTFTNHRNTGSITVIKNAKPNEEQNFHFTITQGEGQPIPFILDDDGNNHNKYSNTQTFENLPTDLYTITEDKTPGWKIVDISCTNEDSQEVLHQDNPNNGESNNVAVVRLGTDQHITCTFTNKGRGRIIVTKYEDLNASGGFPDGEEPELKGWEIHLGQDNHLLEKDISNKEGKVFFENLKEGFYQIDEIIKKGWHQSNIVCDNEVKLPEGLQNDFANTQAGPDEVGHGGERHLVKVDAGEIVHCFIGNFKHGQLIVRKQVIGPDGEKVVDTTGQFKFKITRDSDNNHRSVILGDGGEKTYHPKPDTYHIVEVSNPDYDFVSCNAKSENKEVGIDVDHGKTVFLTSDSTVIVTCKNQQKRGKIIVTKYNDLNGNGVKDKGEDVLPGWDIIVTNGENSRTLPTGDDGTVTFDNVKPRDYVLSETIKNGWVQTNIECKNDANPTLTPTIESIPTGEQGEFESRGLVGVVNAQEVTQVPIDNDNSHDVTVKSNETVHCQIGNKFRNPKLTIDKTNNVLGVDQAPGNNVLYTLTVTATDSSAFNVQVKDLPPSGFKYNLGSWTANSSTRGDLKAASITTEPTYASPGVWQLGTMVPGEVVTLSYQAGISPTQEQGLYKDLAWTQGTVATDPGSSTVLGNDPSTFVGTAVNVVTPNQNTATLASVSTVSNQTNNGQVLGASTGLPSTGAKLIWVILASILMTLGTVSVLLGGMFRRRFRTPKIKHFVRLSILILLFCLVASHAHAATNLSIRLGQPKTPTNLNTFNLSFVVLDTLERGTTVRCFKQGPGDVGFIQFGADIVIAPNAGNNGNCAASSSVVSANGTYQFKTEAIAGSDDVFSEIVVVNYDANLPGTPTNYSKGKIDSCTYQIKFRTADDSGKTVKAEIYRSSDTSFNLDSSNRVQTVAVGSLTDVSVNDVVPDCAKTYYYAVRAFDGFGNGSGPVGDSGITVVITGGTTGTTTTAAGGAAGAGQAQVLGAVAVKNANLPPPGGQGQQQILGEQQPQQGGASQQQGGVKQQGNVLGTNSPKGFFLAAVQFLSNPYVLIPLIIILILVIVYGLRSGTKTPPL